jgi:hypothetical protein
MQKKIPTTWLIAGGLIALAVAWRVFNWENSIAPNLEIVTAAALVAAAFLGKRWAIAVPLVAMAISDMLIGNSMILLFTWSAFALIGLSGLLLRKLKNSPLKLILASTGTALAGSVFFYVVTNFGVWLLGDGAMYPHTWAGLMECYVMGIPFFRTMLLGNLILVPAFMSVAILVQRLADQRHPGEVAERA